MSSSHRALGKLQGDEKYLGEGGSYSPSPPSTLLPNHFPTRMPPALCPAVWHLHGETPGSPGPPRGYPTLAQNSPPVASPWPAASIAKDPSSSVPPIAKAPPLPKPPHCQGSPHCQAPPYCQGSLYYQVPPPHCQGSPPLPSSP